MKPTGKAPPAIHRSTGLRLNSRYHLTQTGCLIDSAYIMSVAPIVTVENWLLEKVTTALERGIGWRFRFQKRNALPFRFWNGKALQGSQKIGIEIGIAVDHRLPALSEKGGIGFDNHLTDGGNGNMVGERGIGCIGYQMPPVPQSEAVIDIPVGL